jgi:hypothetical protein
MIAPISSTPSLRFLFLGLRFTVESLASSAGVVYAAGLGLIWLAGSERESGVTGPRPLALRVLGEPYFLLAIFLAILLSLVVNRIWVHSSSRWVWILPAIWLLYDILETGYWNWYRHLPNPATPLLRGVWDNYFGAHCGASECFNEWFATAPFYASVAYSSVAWAIYGWYGPRAEAEAVHH